MPEKLTRRPAQLGLAIALAILMAALSVAKPNFLTVANLVNLVRQISINGILAVGVTFVLLTGGVDLSLGSLVALTGVVAACFAHPDQYSVLVAVLAGVTAGTLCGAANGWVVARGRIAPFVVTLGMMTAVAVTREYERGTMENLLATPVRPLEVMLGKIVPYIVVGYVQVVVILTAARFLFGVPMVGSVVLLSILLVAFIAANLAIGFTISTFARNQMQAMQMTFFFFLPSMLLSGFMFPFRGMPGWAQAIGEVFPLTHFLRIVRGILLKGSGFAEVAPSVWPLLAILVVVSGAALVRYQRTLD